MKTVKINDKEFNLNSSNELLLEKLPTQRYNPKTGQKEDVMYLPISMVHKLLNGLFDNWSYDEEYLNNGKAYTVKKNKWNNDAKKYELVEEEGEIRQLKATLVVWDGEKKMVHGAIREGYSSTGIITNDDSINGFDSKLSARVLKSLCKRLGNVFCVGGEEDEADVVDKRDIVESLSSETVKATEKSSATPKAEKKPEEITEKPTKTIDVDAIKAKYEELLKAYNGNYTQSDLLVVAKEVKKQMDLKANSAESKASQDIFNQYVTALNAIDGK